jgi:hypothetical protein
VPPYYVRTPFRFEIRFNSINILKKAIAAPIRLADTIFAWHLIPYQVSRRILIDDSIAPKAPLQPVQATRYTHEK